MTRDGLEKIIKKLRKRSNKYESLDMEKYFFYDRCAEYVKDNMSEFENGLEDENEDYKEIVERFKGVLEEFENWDSMFPNGDEDDSITDWMTKD